MKKIFCVLCVFLMLACVLVACGKEEKLKEEKPDIEQMPSADDNQISSDNGDEEQESESQTTFAQFVSTHKQKAKTFAANMLQGKNADLKAVFGYKFQTDSNDLIQAVIAYSISNGVGNERKIMEEKVVLTTPLSIDDILNGNYTNNDIGGTYSQKELFKFDAKENFVKTELGSALFSACDLTTGQIFFNEIESADENIRVFEVAHIENGKTTLYTIEVEKADTEEKLIENLSMDEKTNVQEGLSITTDGQIKDENYTQEEFQPESVEDLVENYSNAVHTVLNSHFYPFITKTLFGRTFDENKLINPEWRILSENNEITGFKFISKYAITSVDEQYKVGTITLSEKVSPKDFTNENADAIFSTFASNATFAQEFSFAYLKAEQGQHDALLSAIFEAKGLGAEAPEGATRYFVGNGSLIDPVIGEAQDLKVMQVEGDKVTIFSIIVKRATTDEGYIAYIQNEDNYYFDSEENINLSGQKFSCTIIPHDGS